MTAKYLLYAYYTSEGNRKEIVPECKVEVCFPQNIRSNCEECFGVKKIISDMFRRFLLVIEIVIVNVKY
nr:MAG TPA_asm: hypothetical protein [Bacteriophage sp.]